jgi:hypothetical protein
VANTRQNIVKNVPKHVKDVQRNAGKCHRKTRIQINSRYCRYYAFRSSKKYLL